MTKERIALATVSIAESAMDFLKRAVDEIEKHPKYSVIHFATAVELILKARLMHEHWALVVEKTSDADVERFLSGDCRTVSPAEAIRRLSKIAGQSIPADAVTQFNRLASHRNRMVHFFHEAGANEASAELLEGIAREQCLCWFHLERLLRLWSDQFAEMDDDITRIAWAMKRNRQFLAVKFEQLKPKIDTDAANGVAFHDCAGCGFAAAEVDDVSDLLHSLSCRVCGLTGGYLQMPCPSGCGHDITIDADHGSHRQCEDCGHVVSQEELTDALSTEYVAHEDFVQMNCAFCCSLGSVVQHGDSYVCTECLSFEEEIALCGWCNEMQIGGGDLEFSYHSGCEFCDGHAGWYRDD